MIRIKHTRWPNHGWTVGAGLGRHTMCYDEFRRYFIVSRYTKEMTVVISKSDNSGGHAHRVRVHSPTAYNIDWSECWDEKMKRWEYFPLTSVSRCFFRRQLFAAGLDPYDEYYVWVEVDS